MRKLKKRLKNESKINQSFWSRWEYENSLITLICIKMIRLLMRIRVMQ